MRYVIWVPRGKMLGEKEEVSKSMDDRKRRREEKEVKKKGVGSI